jgi:tRNA pseudouridine32 synthase/23S rRNA pseudouridine746 synthase
VTLEVVHSDADCIVALKPSGLLSVPGRGAHLQDCLHARLRLRFPDALVVHRLDMATSGLMVFARSIEAQRRLSRAFAQREIEKRYLAVVEGLVVADGGVIDLPLQADWPNRPRQQVDPEHGKPSTTHYRVLSRDVAARTSRVELRPLTGRSHQLRVHLLALGHAIVGDTLYGPPEARNKGDRLLLHATDLGFRQPLTGARLDFRSSAPF